MGQRGRGRPDTAFGGGFQSALECQLNLPCCFLSRASVRHYAGPFDHLGDETFITFFRRVPNPDFVIARVRFMRRRAFRAAPESGDQAHARFRSIRR